MLSKQSIGYYASAVTEWMQNPKAKLTKLKVIGCVFFKNILTFWNVPAPEWIFGTPWLDYFQKLRV